MILSRAISYPTFGSSITEMQYSNDTARGYRYGFIGKELEDETFEGCVAFEARVFDSRVARFFSIDPRQREYLWQSPYAYFENSPISVIDINGEGGPFKADAVGAEDDLNFTQDNSNSPTSGVNTGNVSLKITVYIYSVDITTLDNSGKILFHKLPSQELTKYADAFNSLYDKMGMDINIVVTDKGKERKDLLPGEYNLLIENHPYWEKALIGVGGETLTLDNGKTPGSYVYYDKAIADAGAKSNADKTFIVAFVMAHEIFHSMFNEANYWLGLDEVNHTNPNPNAMFKTPLNINTAGYYIFDNKQPLINARNAVNIVCNQFEILKDYFKYMDPLTSYEEKIDLRLKYRNMRFPIK